MMLHNLIRLHLLTGKKDYQNLSIKMVEQMLGGIKKYPSSFAHWGAGLLKLIYPIREIAVVGKQAKAKAHELLKNGISNYVMMAGEEAHDEFPLLASKATKGDTLIFFCQNFSCERPVVEVVDALSGLR